METCSSEEPSLKFKGVWIPSEIWESKLTWVEKILWSIISTYGKKGDPCFASNEWFAAHLNTTAARIANAISVLRKGKFVVDKGFDGRRRFLLAVVPEQDDEVKAALTPGLTLPQRQGEPCFNARVKAEPPPNKKEIKGEKKMDPILSLPLPKSLNTPEFNELWRQWIEDRRKRKKPMSELAAKKQLNEMQFWGAAKAAQAVEKAIMCGWQKPYEPWEDRKQSNNRGPATAMIVPN